MKLIYRGISYEAAAPLNPVSEQHSKSEANQSMKAVGKLRANLRRPISGLIYRGVRYTR
ncbi:MAG: DUF4278 domain-containing protein [Leptolyngbyaceae cyanobacterium]